MTKIAKILKILIDGMVAENNHMVMGTMRFVAIFGRNKITNAMIRMIKLLTEFEMTSAEPTKEICYILTIEAGTMVKSWKAVISIGKSHEISNATCFKHTFILKGGTDKEVITFRIATLKTLTTRNINKITLIITTRVRGRALATKPRIRKTL